MNLASLFGLSGAAGSLAAGVYAWRQVREKGLDQWLPSYFCRPGARGDPPPGRPFHLFLCIADHFEPKLGGAPPATAKRRVETWVREYPKLYRSFQDSEGRPPRHTFFYPAEEYEPEYLDALAELCGTGFGEVEVHLHHDDDSAAGLRKTLLNFKHRLADRHGLLSRHQRTGEIGYAFIHGNWALDNSRPDGRWCGVNNELDVLRETGCFVDMTLPSAPSPTQTRIINSIYYAVDDPLRPKSHDRGALAGGGPAPDRALLMIQGPLMLDWSRRKWGLLPRIENACLQGNQAPSQARLDLWLRARVQVIGRPDWYFVKLHTHGANEANMPVLLGEPMAALHRVLAERAARDVGFRFHYVTAREMVNLVHAAEAGAADPSSPHRSLPWIANTPKAPPMI